MARLRLPRGAVALACAASLAVAAAPPAEDPDSVGPPLYTSAGCRSDQPFTVEHVAAALDVPKSVVARMLKRYGLHPWQVCALDARRIAPLVAATRKNKFGYDEPDQMVRYRRLSYLDETGTIRANGLMRAARQREENVRAHRGKALVAKAAGIDPLAWTALGPFNVGGRVRAIAPHPTVANRLLLGSVAGGIFRSTDGGATWTSVNDFLPSVAISCLVHDPANPSIVYACTGEGYLNVDAIRGIGLLKSVDAGDTWAPMPTTDPSLSQSWYYVNRLAIDPSNPQLLLAATNMGVMRSLDGGASWTQVTFSRAFDVRFNGDGSRVVVAEYGATLWSGDRMATSTRVFLSGGRGELAYSQSTGNFFLQLDAAGGQVYRSTDGGASWALLSTPAVLGVQGWYDNAIWVDPTNENRIIVGGSSNGIMMSVNGGASFAAIGAGVHSDHHVLVQDPGYATNGIVYNGNDGGIYRFSAVNAVTTPQFSPSSPPSAKLNNLSITQFYSGAGSSVPTTRLMGGTQDNGSFSWQQASGSWIQISVGDGGRAAVQQNDNDYMYGDFQWLAVFRTTNGGIDTYGVEMICNGIADADCGSGTHSTNFISPVVLDPSNPDRLYAAGASLWRTDNARDPLAANVRWARVRPASATINAVAVAPSNPDVVWVGDNDGGLYRTLNGTSATPTWSANLSPSGRQVMRIVIDRDNPARVFATFGGYSAGNVQLTLNGLDAVPAWTGRSGAAPNDLPDAPVRALVAHPFNGDWLYAGTEVGVFASEDGGVSWAATNDGPGTVSVEDLFFLDPNRIVAATHGRGMYLGSVTPPPVAPGALQFATTAVSILEGQAGTIQVNRVGGATGTVGVTVTSANGSAAAGGDYTAIGQTLTWANGDSSPRSVAIDTLPDAIVEGNETFALNLSAPTGGAILGNPSSATVTLYEPDVFPVNCAMPSGWTTPAGAAAGWAVDTGTSFEGRCSLRANPIGSLQEAKVQVSDTFSAGNITFNARVDAQPRADCLHFFIDGTEQATGTNCTFGGSAGNLGLGMSTGTDTGWRAFDFPVSAGNHTLQWVYRKNSSQGSGGADTAWLDNVVLPLQSAVPVLSGIVSRMTHGAAGTFDIPLDRTKPADGAVDVESRTGAQGYKVVFLFDRPITSVAGASCRDPASLAVVGACTASAVGSTVEIALTGVADPRRIGVIVSNMNATGYNTNVTFGLLAGDVDASRAITASDILRLKGLAGQAVNAGTARYDVNADGVIDASDIARLKQGAGVEI